MSTWAEAAARAAESARAGAKAARVAAADALGSAAERAGLHAYQRQWVVAFEPLAVAAGGKDAAYRLVAPACRLGGEPAVSLHAGVLYLRFPTPAGAQGVYAAREAVVADAKFAAGDFRVPPVFVVRMGECVRCKEMACQCVLNGS